MKPSTLPILAFLCASLLALSAQADPGKKGRSGGGAWDFEGKAQIEKVKLQLLEEALIAHTNSGKECHSAPLQKAIAASIDGEEALSPAKILGHFQSITMTIHAKACLEKALHDAQSEKKN